ncbi:MAG: hypothetical protein P8N25_03315 [Alphaproteobacteria bacterium]|nr:hypothetical protein [Alphaproteobacteria bacterium]
MKLSDKLSVEAKDLLIPFLKNQDLDIRSHKDGRWFDQKCQPDVLLLICDCILEYILEDREKKFCKNHIWSSDFFNETVKSFFSKPDAKESTAKNEYDKFTSQPLKMLARAGVLQEKNNKNTNYYKVINFDILKFISLTEKNSLLFIYLYVMETFLQSGFIHYVDEFINNNNKQQYLNVKNKFRILEKDNTPINKDYEPNRIFTPIINVIAFMHYSCGTNRGHISKCKIDYHDLMYNRKNFKDIGKDKNITRSQYREITEGVGIHKEYFVYINKKDIKNYHKFISEIDNSENAIHAHHIFMKSEFPEISAHKENIITLTPDQHLTEAHPCGKTQEISSEYQHFCLIHKLKSVEKSISEKDNFYSMDRYIEVVNTGKPNVKLSLEDNTDTILEKLAIEYRASI